MLFAAFIFSLNEEYLCIPASHYDGLASWEGRPLLRWFSIEQRSRGFVNNFAQERGEVSRNDTQYTHSSNINQDQDIYLLDILYKS